MDFKEIAQDVLGFQGKMLSGSKSRYTNRHEDHLVVFNANVCVEDEKIWQGDIDITLEEDSLIELAQRLGENVYVLYEMDGRFENEDFPKLKEYVYMTDGDGFIIKKSLDKFGYKRSGGDDIKYSPVMEWNGKTITDKIKLPFIHEFMTDSEDKDPLIKFYDWVCDQLGGRPKDMFMDPSKIILCDSSEKELSFVIKMWASKYKSIPKHKLESTVSFHMLDIGPSLFFKDQPSWANSTYVYICEGFFYLKEGK